MPDDNSIKNYSAADIEKYWKGLLSPAEMHALEKTAMDDAFLADALEGYKNTQAAKDDIDFLKQKINERTGTTAAVIPIRSRRFPWLRIAAAVVIFAGLGLLAQQLLLNNRKSEITKTDNQQKQKSHEEPAQPDKLIQPDTSKASGFTFSTTETEKIKPDIQKAETITAKAEVGLKSDSVSSNLVTVIPPAETQDKEKTAAAPATADDARKQEAEKNALAGRKDKTTDGILDSYKSEEKSNQKRGLQNAKKAADFASLNNSFKYRVVDAQNNPVPFASVVNTRDQVGTYSDINGNFNLVSADSLLNVQFKAQGFETKEQQLLPNKKAAEIVMQEDLEARNKILANNRKVVSSRAREENRELEDPEPEVGWGFYDTYIANNLNIPDELRRKNAGSEIELSFQVDKTGQPTNIKVIRSSQCKECDEEAIRLLKVGPKWKRKGKKSKAVVSISVEN
jgi:TonB family protein